MKLRSTQNLTKIDIRDLTYKKKKTVIRNIIKKPKINKENKTDNFLDSESIPDFDSLNLDINFEEKFSDFCKVSIEAETIINDFYVKNNIILYNLMQKKNYMALVEKNYGPIQMMKLLLEYKIQSENLIKDIYIIKGRLTTFQIINSSDISIDLMNKIDDIITKYSVCIQDTNMKLFELCEMDKTSHINKTS
jgi:phage pi2 protein 07